MFHFRLGLSLLQTGLFLSMNGLLNLESAAQIILVRTSCIAVIKSLVLSIFSCFMKPGMNLHYFSAFCMIPKFIFSFIRFFVALEDTGGVPFDILEPILSKYGWLNLLINQVADWYLMSMPIVLLYLSSILSLSYLLVGCSSDFVFENLM